MGALARIRAGAAIALMVGAACVETFGPGDLPGATDGEDPSDDSACGKYLACVDDAAPESSAQANARYAESGTCWSDPTQNDADCEARCRAAMAPLRGKNPLRESCWECELDQDCVANGLGQSCTLGRACSDEAPPPKCETGELGCPCSPGDACFDGYCLAIVDAESHCVDPGVQVGRPGGACYAGTCEPGCRCVALEDVPTQSVCVVDP